jgi:hypothetical protein
VARSRFVLDDYVTCLRAEVGRSKSCKWCEQSVVIPHIVFEIVGAERRPER